MSADVNKMEYERIKSMVEEILREFGAKPNEQIWLTSDQAKSLLNVKTTQLYLLRQDASNGIIYTQPSRKVILYRKDSLLEYLNRNIVS